jgi:hypothetical protein
MNSRIETMLDLLQTFPVEDYFLHKDLPAAVTESVEADPRPFLALLGGPGIWNVDSHPKLPLIGYFKTNSRDNLGMPSKSHWMLIFTAPGREECAILPWTESDKLPPARPQKVPPPPPGTTPKVTYSFRHEWRDIDFHKLPTVPKTWKVALLAGSFISNSLDIQITGQQGHHQDSKLPQAKISPKSISDYPVEDQLRFGHQVGDPQFPKTGIAFSKPVFSGQLADPVIILRGTFRLAKRESMIIHLIFSGPDLPGGLHHKMTIPNVFMEAKGDMVQGQFGLDLADLFRGPSGHVQVPKVLYLTAARGSYIGEPMRMDFQSSR